MKIAILTQPLKSNYGGMMQAFALQQVIKKMGHEVITINRQIDNFSRARLALRNLIKGETLNSKSEKLKIKYSNIIFKNTLEFISKYIKLTKPINSSREMKNHFSENKYDAIIVGSDQTWRPKYSPNIYNFYLDFIQTESIIRIAYASSFGVDKWEYSDKETLKCKNLIKKFDAISVRELSGIELCRQHLSVEAKLMPDPTLLLSSNEYLHLLNIKNQQINTEGIFTYILDRNTEKDCLIYEASKILNLSTFTNQPRFIFAQDCKVSVEDYVYPKVEDWVLSFHKAQFVITDSFHGCVFSIIFNKPFIVIGNHERGLARFTSLLKELNLDNRIIDEKEPLTTEKMLSEINWSLVNKKIDEKKFNAIQFLNKNLK